MSKEMGYVAIRGNKVFGNTFAASVKDVWINVYLEIGTDEEELAGVSVIAAERKVASREDYPEGLPSDCEPPRFDERGLA